MKGIRLQAPWQIGTVDLKPPVVQNDQALIKVKSVGICGSDINAFRGNNPLVTYPRIIGHEIAGEVLSIPNDNPKDIHPGDRVILDPYLYCGHCYPCSIGRTNCCVELKVLGVHVDGGMVEFLGHPADMLVKVPDSLPWELVPMAEPLTISLHGLHRGRLAAGEHIVILGCGPIGLLAAAAALTFQAIPIVIDPVAERLKKASEFGVEYLINPNEEDPVQRVRQITGGRMAEMILEASGANSAIRTSLDLVSHAGRIVLTGWPKEPTKIPTDIITKKEIDIRGGRTSAGEFEEALFMMANGMIPVREILTKTISLEEIPAAVIDIEKHPENYLKVHALLN